MALAADANVDLFSSFTVRILAVHLHLDAVFVIYTSFSLGMSLIFSKHASTCLGLILCKGYSFFFANLSFLSHLSAEDE